MDKKSLVKLMSEKSGVTLKDAEAVLNAFVETVEETVANNEKVQMVGFGTFEKKPTKGREGIIQIGTRKGEAFKTEDGFTPKFSAGKEFKDIVAIK